MKHVVLNASKEFSGDYRMSCMSCRKEKERIQEQGKEIPTGFRNNQKNNVTESEAFHKLKEKGMYLYIHIITIHLLKKQENYVGSPIISAR